MSTQQQAPRPWFRLASMMRPSAPTPAPPPPTRAPPPTTALQPTTPLPPFRPPVAAALPQQTTQPPPPQATAPPTPIRLPAASPGPSASRSPVVTSPAPTSPVYTRASQPQPQPQPQEEEPNKPESPIITTTPIPGAQVVSSSPSPKTNAAPSSSRLPTSPKTNAPPPSPARTSNSNTSPYISSDITAPPPPSPARNSNTFPYITSVITAPSPARNSKSSPSNITAPSPVRPIASPKATNRGDRKTAPDQSPILKPLSHPPSPLTLPPPAQLKPDGTDYLEPIPAEPQQKTVLTQNTLNHNDKQPKITNKHGGGGEVKRDTAKKTINKSTEDQLGMRIVTLTGENKGAVMELSSPSRKKFQGSGHIIDGDQKEGKKVAPAAPVDAFVNSNVQGVNNSILYNCTYRNRDPGVHLSVSRRGNAHHLIKGTTPP